MHRIPALAALICVASAIPLRSQTPVLSVDVNLVNITATALDEYGRYVDDLTAEDFLVLEDGREQKIAFFSHESRLPISLGVLIDSSSSVQDKFRQGLQTVRAIAATLSSTDEMFIMTFDSHVSLRQAFTNDPDEMQRSLRDIHAHGETAVYDAIAAGLREMQKAKYPKRILLLVTDGFDTRSRTTADQAEDLLKRSNVLLYTVGIDDDDKDASIRRRPKIHIYEYMLNKLSRAGGGRIIRLYTGREYDLHQLSEALLGELHQQYTIGYYPVAGTGHDGGGKNVEIRVKKPGVQILDHHGIRPAA